MNVPGSSRRRAAFVLSATLLFCACGGQGRPAPAAVGQAGAYLAPPTLLGAERLVSTEGSASVKLTGEAPAGALVRLRSPDGAAPTAQADADGRWSLVLPGSEAPQMFSFQAELPHQVVRGEGALAVLPPPGPAAVVLRAGFAAAPTGEGRPGSLQLVTFDYDGGGGAAAGFAPPQSFVRLAVDGGVVGVTQADAQGRFAVLALTPRSVSPGHRVVRVETPQGLSIERPIEVAAASLSPDAAFTAVKAVGGWTLAWRLPGGGVQTSQVFDGATALLPQGRLQNRTGAR